MLTQLSEPFFENNFVLLFLVVTVLITIGFTLKKQQRQMNNNFVEIKSTEHNSHDSEYIYLKEKLNQHEEILMLLNENLNCIKNQLDSNTQGIKAESIKDAIDLEVLDSLSKLYNNNLLVKPSIEIFEEKGEHILVNDLKFSESYNELSNLKRTGTESNVYYLKNAQRKIEANKNLN